MSIQKEFEGQKNSLRNKKNSQRIILWLSKERKMSMLLKKHGISSKEIDTNMKLFAEKHAERKKKTFIFTDCGKKGG